MKSIEGCDIRDIEGGLRHGLRLRRAGGINGDFLKHELVIRAHQFQLFHDLPNIGTEIQLTGVQLRSIAQGIGGTADAAGPGELTAIKGIRQDGELGPGCVRVRAGGGHFVGIIPQWRHHQAGVGSQLRFSQDTAPELEAFPAAAEGFICDGKIVETGVIQVRVNPFLRRRHIQVIHIEQEGCIRVGIHDLHGKFNVCPGPAAERLNRVRFPRLIGAADIQIIPEDHAIFFCGLQNRAVIGPIPVAFSVQGTLLIIRIFSVIIITVLIMVSSSSLDQVIHRRNTVQIFEGDF